MELYSHHQIMVCINQLDNGTTWSVSLYPVPNGYYIGIKVPVKTSSGVLLASNNGRGIYISTDDGVSWSQSNSGLGADTSISVMAINSNDEVYISTGKGKVYKSTDNGASWTAVSNSDFLNQTGNYFSVNQLIISSTNMMYASTSSGLYITNLVTGITSENNQLPTGYNLAQNYPNPFNPSTKINFSIPKSSFVTLKIYDVLGKEVANLVNEQLSAGTYNYNFDASRLTSGIYFYRIQSNDFVETKKMILIK